MSGVLDIGCGFGDTAIKLALRVGQSGKVVGLDCCEAFLEYGRKDAAKLGLRNVSFVNGDALLYHFEPEYCLTRLEPRNRFSVRTGTIS